MEPTSKNIRQDIVDLLSRLVACPSVGPGRRRNFGSPFGEEKLARLLTDIVSGWGAEVTLQEVASGRPNLIAKFAGRDSGRSLMLEAHGDTVAVEGMKIEPFRPMVKEGRLYGRGACDVKGSMASMLLAIRKVLDEDGAPPTDVFFVATADEEGGATGAYELMKSGFRTDAAVVAEPTDLTIVRAHKGIVRWAITTKGLSAHSSAPGRGKNAIVAMSKIIERIDGPISRTLSGRHHPDLGEPTISVGTIKGGTQVNVVPDCCTIEVDRRLLPSETKEQATEELATHIESLELASSALDYAIEEIQYYPPFDEPANSRISQRTAAACQKHLGRKELDVAAWGANSGVFREAGIPCVLFGPGSIKQAHTDSEFIEIDQMVKAGDVYAEIISTW